MKDKNRKKQDRFWTGLIKIIQGGFWTSFIKIRTVLDQIKKQDRFWTKKKERKKKEKRTKKVRKRNKNQFGTIFIRVIQDWVWTIFLQSLVGDISNVI